MSVIDDCYKQDINSIVYELEDSVTQTSVSKVFGSKCAVLIVEESKRKDYDCFNATLKNYTGIKDGLTFDELYKIMKRSIFIHGVYNGVYSSVLKMLLNINDEESAEWYEQYKSLRNLKMSVYYSLGMIKDE